MPNAITNEQILAAVENLKQDTHTAIERLSNDNVVVKEKISSMSDAIEALTTNQHATIEAISIFSTSMDEKHLSLEQRFDGLDTKVTGMDVRLNRVESQMVTKEYLDNKLADLRVDLGRKDRQLDAKIDGVIDVLEKKKIMTKMEAKKLSAIG